MGSTGSADRSHAGKRKAGVGGAGSAGSADQSSAKGSSAGGASGTGGADDASSAHSGRSASSYSKGEQVLYCTRSGESKPATIRSVDHGNVPPSYTILLEGRERETEADRLRPFTDM